MKIFRHKDGIAFEFNGQLTSVNDRGKDSVRGINDLYNKLNDILLELGIAKGEYEKKKEEKEKKLQKDVDERKEVFG